MSKSFVIGIDFGGVLSVHDNKALRLENSYYHALSTDETRNPHENQASVQNDFRGKEHKNTSIDMPRAKESLEILQKNGHELNLISFCGKARAQQTQKSLDDEKLSKLFKNQCYVKSKQSKNELCQYLGCHFMIDDNLEILNNIRKHNPNIVTIWFEGTSSKFHKIAKDWKSKLIISSIDLNDFMFVPLAHRIKSLINMNIYL